MDQKIYNNRIDITIQNNLPAGSFFIKDGKLIPNLPKEDEQEEVKKEDEENLKNKKAEK